MAGQKVGLTLAEAQRCWPNATVSSTGDMPRAGEYIIPHAYGWVHAGFSIGALTYKGRTLSSRDALAYNCGTYYGRQLDSWEQWATYIDFTTGNTVNYCYDAWNNWETPNCSGGGACQPPSIGVIGNNTYTVNPWYNQSVIYLGNVTDNFFCRHYLSADLSWRASCT
jgi:hypothetical protein